MMLPRKCGIAVFPVFDDPIHLKRCYDYIMQAATLGYSEVFSSLHIQELDYTQHMDGLQALVEFIHSLGMEFSLDISGSMARRLMGDQALTAACRKIPIDWLRLDFGFAPVQVLEVAATLHLGGLMLNASVLSPDEVETQVAFLHSNAPNLRLRAHHNYYPLPETGLSLDFMNRRSAQYKPYGLSVTACLASLQEPRLPLFKGLPTVEHHRYANCQLAAAQLLQGGMVDTLLFGDPFASHQELAEVAQIALHNCFRLRVALLPSLDQAQRRIVLDNTHRSRPDQAACSIRSWTSREMAAQGPTVTPLPPQPRHRYDVAIDNSNALRYSGELHLLTCDMEATPTQNIVGSILPQDYWLLDYLSPGCNFILEEVLPC